MAVFGALTGDILGSTFEFQPWRGDAEALDFFPPGSFPTDDSVLTCAVAQALLDAKRPDAGVDHERFARAVEVRLREFARAHAGAGYGGRFIRWMLSDDAPAYGSLGNGSAMRVSPCAWAALSFDEALELARLSAIPTHNHPEGVLGAQAAAAAVWWFREGRGADEVRALWAERFAALAPLAPLSTLTPPIPNDVTCSGTVPIALEAALESGGVLETVRRAVALGGDCDTIAAIAGAVAEGAAPVPDFVRSRVLALLPEDLRQTALAFESAFPRAYCTSKTAR